LAAKHRITVNLGNDEYGALVAIAERSDRSMAWVGRRAILDFIAAQERAEVPLLAGVGDTAPLAGKSAR